MKKFNYIELNLNQDGSIEHLVNIKINKKVAKTLCELNPKKVEKLFKEIMKPLKGKVK